MGIFSKSEPEPIKRGTVGAVASATGTAAKWGGAAALLGAVAMAAIPLALAATTAAVTLGLGALSIYAFASVGAAAAGTATAVAAGGVLAGLGALFTAVVGGLATIASVPTTMTGVGVAATGGGLFGLFKGAKRVGRENQAYNERAGNREELLALRMDQERRAGMQEGYMIAENDPDLIRMHALQAAQEKQAVGKHTGNAVNAPGVTPHVG